MPARNMVAREDHHHQHRAMASGGITPAAPGMTVQPMVSTKKNVPMNSAMYFLIVMYSFGSRRYFGREYEVPSRMAMLFVATD